MRKVRKQVFETNSSSSHVLHIDSDVELLDTSLVPDEEGRIVVYGGEYGWQWDKLTSAYDKISYAISTDIDKDMLVKVIKKQTGATEVILDGDSGYIDHDSIGILNKAFVNEETLKNYIFNPRSIVFLGNDNDSAPKGFYFDKDLAKYKIAFISKVDNRDIIIDDIIENKEAQFDWIYILDDTEHWIREAMNEYTDNNNIFPELSSSTYWTMVNWKEGDSEFEAFVNDKDGKITKTFKIILEKI